MRKVRNKVRNGQPKIDPGLKYGYRSGLEDSIAADLEAKGIEFTYEKDKVSFIQPEKKRTYTPDFKITTTLGYSFFIETKGRFITADRMKHLWVKEQYPGLDIRFVFTNPKTRLSKTSKTTYADWCDKYGFKWTAKTVPDSWLSE